MFQKLAKRQKTMENAIPGFDDIWVTENSGVEESENLWNAFFHKEMIFLLSIGVRIIC
jgi:hypothetical protein